VRGECVAVQEIAEWLDKLGMPEYGECFAENKIDLSVLPHLTDQDLKDIGVPAIRESGMRPAIFSLRSTAGLLKGSTRAI